ncbi:uncharacterized protein RHO17_000677 isoform 1-T2 [Thomomys bottae]
MERGRRRAPTFMARGRGHGEEVAAGAGAAKESRRSGRGRPGGAPRSRLAESSWAPRVGAVKRSPSGHRHPGLRSRRLAVWGRGTQGTEGAGGEGQSCSGTQGRSRGPARARRRLFRGEALPLQRPSATVVIRAFQPQMWA